MYSTTYLAEIVKVISLIGFIFGYEVNEQEILEVISAVAFALATIYTLYKRWKLGGVSALGIRKK